MQGKYGAYAFPAGQMEFVPSARLVLNAGGQYFKSHQTAKCKGYLNCNGQADATLQMSALVNALSKPFQDLIMFHDDGTPSAMKLLNAPSLTGVRLCSDVVFPENDGAEHATIRSFKFEMEAEYVYPGAANLLMSFHESLSIEGGGPRTVYLEAINTPPQPQQPCLATICRATQSGNIKGFQKLPDIPKPVFPQWQLGLPKIQEESPTRMGQGYEGYGFSYKYEFAAPFRLTGVPNIWIS